MATVVLLTRVNLKEESMLLLPEMSFVPTEGDSFPRLISPEAHLLKLKLIENLFAESTKIGKLENWKLSQRKLTETF